MTIRGLINDHHRRSNNSGTRVTEIVPRSRGTQPESTLDLGDDMWADEGDAAVQAEQATLDALRRKRLSNSPKRTRAVPIKGKLKDLSV